MFKVCRTCAHGDKPLEEEPCKTCRDSEMGCPNWEQGSVTKEE